MAMPDSQTLWVRMIDGKVDYSSDGGTSWANRTPPSWSSATSTRQPPPPPGLPPETVSSAAAWLAEVLPGGSVSVASSRNGGKDWQSAILPRDYPDGTGLVGVSVVNQSTGWASVQTPTGSAFANTDVFQTTDGGSSWQFESTIDGAAGPVVFVTPQVGFAANSPGKSVVMETTDGGHTWHSAALTFPTGTGVQFIIGSPVFTDPSHGFIYGVTQKVAAGALASAFMDVTNDGGTSWKVVSIPLIDSQPSRWSIVSATDWFLISPNTILHTTDGGGNWTTITPDRTLTDVADAQFVSDSVGVALIASEGCTGLSLPAAGPGSRCGIPDTLVRTVDGGRTWQNLPSPPN